MRVIHYLIIVACLCGAGGLLLEHWVASERQITLQKQSYADQTSILNSDVSRLADNIRSLLITTDLVFGVQESYLVDGASRQLSHVHTLLTATVASLASHQDAGLLVAKRLEALLQRLSTLLNNYAQRIDPPTDAEQIALLQQSDALTSEVVHALELLKAWTGDTLHVAQQNLANNAASANTTVQTAVIGYMCFVLCVLVWASRAVSLPIKKLQDTALESAQEGSAFEPLDSGPLEIKQLSTRIGGLINSLESELNRSKAIMAAIPDTLLIIDGATGIRHIQPSTEFLRLFPTMDARGWNFMELLSVEDLASAQRHIQRCVRERIPQQFTLTLTTSESSRQLEARVSASGDGTALVVLRDLTEKLHAEHQIRRLAYQDALTGLLNRTSITQRVSERIDAAKQTGDGFALAFIDIDRFKLYNDSLGHDAGDKVLQHIAAKITSTVRFDPDRPFSDSREQDIPARIGGDEFMILLQGINCEATANQAAARIVEAIAEPLHLGEQPLSIKVSMGVSLYPQHATSQSDLFLQSDIAMYEAKRNGGGQHCLYDEEFGKQSRRRLSMESRLQGAIERDELYLDYQPQFDLTTNAIIGAEALLRWRDGDKQIPPGEFIPIAEESGMILAVGELVMLKAIDQIAGWTRRGIDLGMMHINVSVDQFSEPSFFTLLVNSLQAANVPAAQFGIEVTETVVVQDFERAKNVLTKIRNHGICIAMDDFGTGYSSLNYLKHLPLDLLKIDRSFLSSIGQSSKETTLISTIVQLGHELGMKVLAEGVETEEQLQVLKQIECDWAQGYLLGRPMNPDSLEALLVASKHSSKAPEDGFGSSALVHRA